MIKYTSAQCAAYAKDRLDGFEYPPGYRMAVRYYNDRTVDMHGRSVVVETYDHFGSVES